MNSEIIFPSLFEIAPVLFLVLGGLYAMIRGTSKSTTFPVIFTSSAFFLPAIFWQGMLFRLPSDGSCGLVSSHSLIVLFSQLLMLIAAYFAVLNFSDEKHQKKLGLGEKVALVLFSSAGGYVLLATQNLVTWYLSLEIISISSYALVGSNLRSKFSTEAAVKYLIQGALGSCLILFSFATIYGVTASLDFEVIRSSIAVADRQVVLLSLGFFVLGFSLKLGLVPFHYWVPDVYQGADSAVTNYLAGVLKSAIAIAGFLLMSEVFPELIANFNKMLWVILALSIVIGNLLAIFQNDVKRILAYSAIAHTAYFSIGLLEPTIASFQQAFFAYLVFYTILSLISFTVIDALEEGTNEIPGVPLGSLKGLIYRSPFLGLVFVLALLSLASFPPVFYALLAKVFVLKALLSAGYIGMSLLIVFGTVIGCFYYFKMIALVLTAEECEDRKLIKISKVKILTLSILVFSLLYYSVFPSRIFDFVSRLLS